MLRRPEITARIAEIRAVVAKRNDVTQDRIISDLYDVFDSAKASEKTLGAAVNAQVAIAKVSGFWVDRVQHSVENMSDKELVAAIESEQPGSVVSWDRVLEKSRGR